MILLQQHCRTILDRLFFRIVCYLQILCYFPMPMSLHAEGLEMAIREVTIRLLVYELRYYSQKHSGFQMTTV
jgi:hypothetical protein